MKLIYIKYRTIYFSLIAIFLILIISTILIINNHRNTKETFINDDIYYKGTKEEKILAFACNVDWGNEYIPEMLNIFKNNEMKITFFITGRWAENNPELLTKIYDEGHEIGNHGYFHRDYNLLNYAENKKEIEKADFIITEILGIKSKYFAPPSGAYNEETIKAAKDLDYKVIMWSIDTIDWRKDSTKDKIIDRVLSKRHNSAIVLMHPKEETIKALPIIIQNLKNEGYKIGRISDIMD